MSEKYPPSILISLYASVVLTTLFLILGKFGGILSGRLLNFGLIFFLFSLFMFTIIIEFFLYRKIKSIAAEDEKVIKKLKEMETFRREFLGDVSHELKTPIFAIMGFVETLLDGAIEDPKVSKRFLTKALKHSTRLSDLVKDILLLTQIESGDLKIFLEPFDLVPLINETVDSLDERFSSKKRNFLPSFKYDKNKKIMVLGDSERIQQVLYNLLENAIKYGDQEGNVDILIEEFEEKVHVKIRDYGTGIEEEHINRIFERFYRVDKSRSREKGGTGLGLAICRNFIEAHGERIWSESTIGEGSIFQFTLRKENGTTEK